MTVDSKHDDQKPSEEEQAFLKQLKHTFDSFTHDIPLYLFTEPGEDIFADGCRQIIRAFRQLTPRITLKEFGLDHELAKKWHIEGSPTLIIDPDHYHIRWLGAPLGEEGRSFLEAMLLIGLGKSGLSDQSASIVRSIDGQRDVSVFVSPTCPYCPQQVVNALRVAIERPDIINLEIIDIQARPDLADKYDAHSVPQAFVDDILIGMGAQQEEVFVSSLKKMEAQTIFIPESTAEVVETDIVIVGGGPAGLTAGIYAVRSGLNAAMIERDALGGQVALTPVVENYPGFSQVGGKSLVDIMISHALQYVQIFQGEEVVNIKQGDPIEVQTTRRQFLTKAILLATGATHRKLGVPGESEMAGRGVSYCATCDGPLFKGRKVIMVGGGNSAVTEALHLKHMGVDVTLVHRRDALRAQKTLADQLPLNQIDILYHTEVQEITGGKRVEKVILKNNETGKTVEMLVDGVFIAIGYEPAVELAKKIGVNLTDDGYIQHDDLHRTNIRGVYSAGDVEGGYKQIVTAAGQGAAAAMTIFEDLINPYWKKDKAN